MKITDVSIHTKVISSDINGDRKKFIGEIVSEEVKRASGGGQFQVLVQYETERRPRWVAGGRLVKVNF